MQLFQSLRYCTKCKRHGHKNIECKNMYKIEYRKVKTGACNNQKKGDEICTSAANHCAPNYEKNAKPENELIDDETCYKYKFRKYWVKNCKSFEPDTKCKLCHHIGHSEKNCNQILNKKDHSLNDGKSKTSYSVKQTSQEEDKQLTFAGKRNSPEKTQSNIAYQHFNSIQPFGILHKIYSY